MQLLPSIQASFRKLGSPKDGKGEFQVSLNCADTSYLVKWNLLHFWGPQQRVDVNNWPNYPQYWVSQSCWYPDPLWDWKSMASACVLSIASYCLHFIERNLWLQVDQSSIYLSLKRPLVLRFCSFGGKWLLKRFQGWNYCYIFCAVFPALAVSGLLAFSRNSSFFCSEFSFFRRKSTQKFSLLYLGVFCHMNFSVSFWSVRVKTYSGLKFFQNVTAHLVFTCGGGGAFRSRRNPLDSSR